MKLKNTSQYRKSPLKRTIDTFIDNQNLSSYNSSDIAKPRQNQIRRDKDNIRSIGITLYDIDFAVKTFIDQSMKLRVDENGEIISVPVIYANAEKWASIQRNGYLKDKKGKTLVPLITFRRSGVNMKNELRRNKVATVNQLAYVFKQKYNNVAPYDRFSTLYGTQNRRPQEYFITPVPDYVDVTYDFIVWTEYQSQLNFIVEQFVYFTGQSFGERNFLKFATNVDSFAMEDSNTSGQDRTVRANFQITVHGYLLPKNVAGDVTTKRVIAPNRITFNSEVASGDVLVAYDHVNGNGFTSINASDSDASDELNRRLTDFRDTSINRSPDVYSTENE